MAAISHLAIIVILLNYMSKYMVASQSLPEPALVGSACYGFHPFAVSCDPSQVIAVRTVALATKLETLACPPEVEVWNGEVVDAVTHLPINTTRCCEVQPDDGNSSCSIPHVHSTYRYRRSCTGYQECLTGGVPVERRPAYPQCDQNLYMNYTNFLHMDYHCINASRIRSVCATTTQTTTDGDALYVQSPSYPTDISSNLNSTQCTVQTNDSGSDIHVYTIDVHLEKNGSECHQSLDIRNSSGHVLSWTCDNQTLYNITNTTLSGGYLLVNFTSNMSIDAGRFWIGVQASKAGVNLRIECSIFSPLACGTQALPTSVSVPTTTPESTTLLTSTGTNNASRTTASSTAASNNIASNTTGSSTTASSTIASNTTTSNSTSSFTTVMVQIPTSTTLSNSASPNTSAASTNILPNSKDVGTNSSFEASRSTDQSKNGSQLAVILGIVFGLLVLLVIVAVIIYCCCCKKKKKVITDEDVDAEADTKPSITGITNGNVLISRAPVRTMFGSHVKLPGNQLPPTRFIMEHNGVQPMVPPLDQNLDRPSNRLPPLLPASTATVSPDGEMVRKKQKKKRRYAKPDQNEVVALQGPQDDGEGTESKKKRKKKNKKRKQVDIVTTVSENKS